MVDFERATALLSQEGYSSAFLIKAHEVEPPGEDPTFMTIRPTTEAIKQNLMNVPSEQDPIYGMRYLIEDTSQLVGGPVVRILLTPHPGAMPTWTNNLTQREFQNLLNTYYQNRERYHLEQRLSAAIKAFMVEVLPAATLCDIKDRVTKFKNVVLEDMLDHVRNEHPAEPEDRNAVKARLAEKWDMAIEIKVMMDEKTELHELLADMKNQATYAPSEWIDTMYMAVQGTEQFIKACEDWKDLPALLRVTEQQFRFFFQKKYKLWKKKQGSLAKLGIANNVQVQQALDVANKEITQLKGRMQSQENENAAIAHALLVAKQQHQQQQSNSTASILKEIQTSLNVQPNQSKIQTQLQELQNMLKQQQSSCDTIINGGGGGGRGGGGRGRGRGGGGRGGGDRSGRGRTPVNNWKPQSDAPAGVIKTKKFYDNNNCCSTHGYDIAINHFSKNCLFPGENHNYEHTGENPKPGASQKDKEFSIYKDQPIPT